MMKSKQIIIDVVTNGFIIKVLQQTPGLPLQYSSLAMDIESLKNQIEEIVRE